LDGLSWFGPRVVKNEYYGELKLAVWFAGYGPSHGNIGVYPRPLLGVRFGQLPLSFLCQSGHRGSLICGGFGVAFRDLFLIGSGASEISRIRLKGFSGAKLSGAPAFSRLHLVELPLHHTPLPVQLVIGLKSDDDTSDGSSSSSESGYRSDPFPYIQVRQKIALGWGFLAATWAVGTAAFVRWVTGRGRRRAFHGWWLFSAISAASVLNWIGASLIADSAIGR